MTSSIYYFQQSVRPQSLYVGIVPSFNLYKLFATQPAFTCSKLTIETPEQGVKYVQS